MALRRVNYQKLRLLTGESGCLHWLVKEGQTVAAGDVMLSLAHPAFPSALYAGRADIVSPRAGRVISVDTEAEGPPAGKVLFSISFFNDDGKLDWDVFGEVRGKTVDVEWAKLRSGWGWEWRRRKAREQFIDDIYAYARKYNINPNRVDVRAEDG